MLTKCRSVIYIFSCAVILIHMQLHTVNIHIDTEIGFHCRLSCFLSVWWMGTDLWWQEEHFHYWATLTLLHRYLYKLWFKDTIDLSELFYPQHITFRTHRMSNERSIFLGHIWFQHNEQRLSFLYHIWNQNQSKLSPWASTFTTVPSVICRVRRYITGFSTYPHSYSRYVKYMNTS